MNLYGTRIKQDMHPFACRIIVFLLMTLPSSGSAQLVNRAPDVYPGTLPEMRTPSYWIARMAKPDEILLTHDDIGRMNESFRIFMSQSDPFRDIPDIDKRSLISWWPGCLFSDPNIAALSGMALADSVRSWISAEADYMTRGRFGNAAGVRYRTADLDRFAHEMAMDMIPRSVTIQKGIAVRTTQLRIIPTIFPYEQGVCDSSLSVSGKNIAIAVHWDTWNNGNVKIGNPVDILHVSRTGEFLFVLNDLMYGWARAGDIATGDAREMENWRSSRDFVVCTGNRVALFTDSRCRIATGWFGMGDTLPLVSASNRRVVAIPVRNTDGSFATGEAWLAENADVHIGRLPYTRRNVVLTAFKLLDSPYDWSGAWFGRNHITTYRDIFAVFGFDLPGHDGLFYLYGKTRKKAVRPDIGRYMQFRAILDHEPFITIISCGGHAKLLLGEYNGMPIVFDNYGHGYIDGNGNYVELCRSFVGDMKIPAYFMNNPLTFLELK